MLNLYKDYGVVSWTRISQEVRMARRALSISPNCADAYNLLAEEEAKTVEEAKELYQKAISAAEKTIQKKTLKDLKERFWGHMFKGSNKIIVLIR